MAQTTNIKVTTGQPVHIDECPFTWANHIFIEWNTDRQGLGQTYHPGDVVAFQEPVKLYAIWAELHEIEFDDNVHVVEFDRNETMTVEFDDNVHEIQFWSPDVVEIQFEDNTQTVAFEDNVEALNFEDNSETVDFEDNTETVAFEDCHGGNT